MKKYFCLATIFILFGTFGIAYAQDSSAEDTADGAIPEIENDPKITGAKSLYWYDLKERKQKGVMVLLKTTRRF